MGGEAVLAEGSTNGRLWNPILVSSFCTCGEGFPDFSGGRVQPLATTRRAPPVAPIAEAIVPMD